jgi:transposase-like protein
MLHVWQHGQTFRRFRDKEKSAGSYGVSQISGAVKERASSLKKAKFIAALAEAELSYARACKKAGINRTLVYKWLKDDQEFKEKVDQRAEELIDEAEESLVKHWKKGSLRALQYFLDHKARHRGYGQRTIIEDNREFEDDPEKLKKQAEAFIQEVDFRDKETA